MMERTDRHFRYFMRLITRRTLLYSEMITTGALLHGDRRKLLGFDPAERPLALQLGGSDPRELAECARIAEAWGYDEVNLNVGCPSPRVREGAFGACLMAEPEVVARCVEAMRRATLLPVTVKHRLGIDDRDRYRDLTSFLTVVAQAGADRFIVHARKAWLSGLSPKENRTVPPLRYHWVWCLKSDFPQLRLEVNGGIVTLAQAHEQLLRVDGVMIGRASYENPYLFALADRWFYADESRPPTRREVVLGMLPYSERLLAAGGKLIWVSRHLLTLFNGQVGAKAWRRHLSENAYRPGAGPEVILAALERVPASVLDAPPQFDSAVTVA